MKARVFVLLTIGLVLLAAGLLAWTARAADPQPIATPSSAEQREAIEDSQTWPAMLPAVSAATAATQDNFGYVWSETTYAWQDIVGSTAVFTNTDNEASSAIPLGFSFPYYENQYTEVYINSNGMLTFGLGNRSRSNVALPQNPDPNNFIAPLWTNLTIGPNFDNPTGVVYFANKVDHVVIEWYQVGVRDVLSATVTFEVLLYNTGDIVFQYQTVKFPTGYVADLTTGIEDADGIDGLMVLYNTLPTASKAILFDRPAKASRAKMLPALQGNFANDRQAAFVVQVRNTGDDPAKPTDVFNLTSASTGSGWATTFWAANGSTPLGDSDGNGVPDTGSVAQGQSVTVVAKVSAVPASTTSSKITLTAQSKNSPAKTAISLAQVAISSAFAQAYADNSLHIGLYSPDKLSTADVDSSFPGSNMSLALVHTNYAFTWEINFLKFVNDEPVLLTNTEYAMFDSQGRLVHSTTLLTDNSSEVVSTRDRSPMMAATTDGTIGAIWYRQVYDPIQGTQDNIYFSRLQADGTLIAGSATNVTKNTSYRATGTLNVPNFYSPRVIATSNGSFLLTWSDERLTSQGVIRDIWVAIYQANGTQVLGPTRLTASVVNSVSFSYPSLATLTGDRIFISYTLFNEVGDTYSIAYAVLNSAGSVVKAATSLAGAQGDHSDVAVIQKNNILIAWQDVTKAQIGYAILDNAYAVVSAPRLLPNPDLIPRPADYVSVTPDSSGNGIITWMDYRWNTHLYYALTNPQGTLLVEPMIFITASSFDVLMQTSYTGYGNALRPQSLYLPILRK